MRWTAEVMATTPLLVAAVLMVVMMPAANDSMPVIPLFSYASVINGTFYQIPILWTALSVALGVDIRGDIIRGLPCVKMLHQLLCTRPGNTYPSHAIERFIDDNKALIRRMYGEFGSSADEPFSSSSSSFIRGKRDVFHSDFWRRQPHHHRHQEQDSSVADACQSKTEVVTPYWASNSAGKIRAIVNTQHFEQAIYQEICHTGRQTRHCAGGCSCEQKYKWHRLLAYDPDNDCAGIFMDWFLFPSCCVCRCDQHQQ
ncbi:unnamed protein product [Notodromas monacha]|uniref:Spaetzle domain-containing protein n=1 Tax=Notodromas monacha TaxID=399045 RepID=A0A7R9BRY5_9CRUS|nr:unnamed protein product [Notodromas monacha]CAG0919204.1 unnamed protein product [Notodromas monacha]